MAKPCFCGCGREIPWEGLLGRRRAVNVVGAQYEKDLALFEGAAEQAEGAERDELLSLVARGRPLRDQLQRVVHGEMDRKRLDRAASRAWMADAREMRKRLAEDMIEADFAGWDALGQSQLWHAGARAPAVLVAVDDTGTTINNHPRVRVRLRVEPEGEAPFEVERKVTVSRVEIPRAGERVEVAYDPEDREEFTFRMADLSDDAAAPREPTRLEKLEKLGELRASGVLTDEEFEAEKARILAEP